MKKIKVNKFQYLSDVGDGCEARDFWEIVETAFIAELGNFCPVQCSPMILPSGKLDICLPGFEFACAADVLQRVANEKLDASTKIMLLFYFFGFFCFCPRLSIVAFLLYFYTLGLKSTFYQKILSNVRF